MGMFQEEEEVRQKAIDALLPEKMLKVPCPLVVDQA
jgi:hypothetical protein